MAWIRVLFPITRYDDKTQTIAAPADTRYVRSRKRKL